MRLSDEERAMLAGELGVVRPWGISHQIAVGEFFDAEDFVPVSQAHIIADTESLGEAGGRLLQRLTGAPAAEPPAPRAANTHPPPASLFVPPATLLRHRNA